MCCQRRATDAYSSTVDNWQRCEIWRVMGAARRDSRERCCDSAANTSATAARVLKGRVGQQMMIMTVLVLVVVTVDNVLLPQRRHHLTSSSPPCLTREECIDTT